MNSPKTLRQKTTTRYILTLRDDGILHCHVTNRSKWSPEDFRLLFPVIGEMVNYEKVPVMMTYEEGTYPSLEAAAEWADPEKNCPYFSFEAHVMYSLPLKVLSNFYIENNNPERLTKFFSNEQDAAEWLRREQNKIT